MAGLLDDAKDIGIALARLIANGYSTGSMVIAPNQADVEMRPKLAKGLLELAPLSGDVISGYEAYKAAREKKYGEAALNGVGLLPFIPALGGMLKPGKYPSHMWNLRGEELSSAMDDISSAIPAGIPGTHQEEVAKLVNAIRDRGLLPLVDVDKGGSVYVSALKPKVTASGRVSKKSKPEVFGAPTMFGGTTPYSVRFADHGQYYPGPMSIDPHSGNTLDTAIQKLDYLLGKEEKPKIGSSYIIPATGEQGRGL
jgi:hypothetical protein